MEIISLMLNTKAIRNGNAKTESLRFMLSHFKSKTQIDSKTQGQNKGLFLLTLYVVLGYNFEYVISSILNLHVFNQTFINRYIFSSFKETNWLINKGKCVIFLMDILQ